MPNTPSIEELQGEISLTVDAEYDHHITGKIFCYTIQFPNQNVIINQRDPLQAYKVRSDPDTMYLHKAIISDWPNCRLAIQRNTMIEWKVIVSLSFINLKSYGQSQYFQQSGNSNEKRDIKSGTIKKYKSCFNIDGSRMKQGIHYD